MGTEDEEKKRQLEDARKRYAKLKNKKGKSKPSDSALPESTKPESVDTKASDTPIVEEEDNIAEQKETSKELPEKPRAPLDSQDGKVKELEEQNEQLRAEQESLAAKLLRLEGETKLLREANSELEELREKASKVDTLQAEIDRVTSELESSRRQNTQLQAAATKRRTSSIALPQPPADVVSDLRLQLESKTSIIESLELDRATFSTKLSALEKQLAEKTDVVETLEEKVKLLNEESEKKTTAIERLSKELEQQQDKMEEEESSRILAESNAQHLSHQLEEETKRAEEAHSRLKVLERKLAEISSSSSDDADRSNSEVQRLRAQVAELSGQLSKLQTGLNYNAKEGGGNHGLTDEDPFDEVDLSSSQYSHFSHPTQPRSQSDYFLGRSSLVDVISSGLSAFTSQARGHQTPLNASQQLQHLQQQQSHSGPTSYQEYLRQEQDSKRAFEARILDRKAALASWKGWRLDLASSRVAVASDIRLEL